MTQEQLAIINTQISAVSESSLTGWVADIHDLLMHVRQQEKEHISMQEKIDELEGEIESLQAQLDVKSADQHAVKSAWAIANKSVDQQEKIRRLEKALEVTESMRVASQERNIDLQRHRDAWREYAYGKRDRPKDYLDGDRLDARLTKIDELEAQLIKMDQQCAVDCNEMLIEIRGLEAQLARAVSALEKYADPDKWMTTSGERVPLILGPYVASEVLASLRTGEKEK